jgi:hypothetical protein
MSAVTPISSSRASRRTAFLVGINYLNNPSATLNGCYNDVVNVSQYLRTVLGYSPSAISLLTDGNRGGIGASALPPTRQNIIAGLTALVAGMISGDEAVFHFSGHGTLVRDTNGDEMTGLDSCICPLDYNVSPVSGGGIITDDEIRTLLVNKVPKGARLYIILDCCHNGTGCDVRYKYEDYSILLSPPTASNRLPVWRTQQKAFANGKYRDTAGEVFMISGSRDEQTSADAYINNDFAGALTYAVFAILRANQAKIRTYSWSELLRDVRHFMRVNSYSQIPQVMTGQLISPAKSVFVVPAGLSRNSALDLTTGGFGIGDGSRDIASNNTLFSFTPKSGSKNTRASIQFLH